MLDFSDSCSYHVSTQGKRLTKIDAAAGVECQCGSGRADVGRMSNELLGGPISLDTNTAITT